MTWNFEIAYFKMQRKNAIQLEKQKELKDIEEEIH